MLFLIAVLEVVSTVFFWTRKAACVCRSHQESETGIIV